MHRELDSLAVWKLTTMRCFCGVKKKRKASPTYSSVLKYRNLIAQNGKIQNQKSRKLSRMQKFISYKSFLEFYLVHKIVCLKFLRPILKTLEPYNPTYCIAEDF